MMTRKFKVAGHVFALTLPDSCTLWQYLNQYDPFVTEEDCEPIFTLDLLEGDLPDGDRETVYDVPTEAGETVIRLFSLGDRYIFEMSPERSRPVTAALVTSLDYSHGSLWLANRHVSDAVFGINNSMMLLFALRTAVHGTLEMHASMVSNGGKAFLFLAKSGTGKSTHSQLWLDNVPGTELMNDDNPIVRIWPDGRVIAYGSPWSGKTPCYRNVEAPVGAFVRIRRCAENHITRLSNVEAYALLYSSCSGLKTDDTMSDGLHESMAAAVMSTPCYVLDCRPDKEASDVSSAELLGL